MSDQEYVPPKFNLVSITLLDEKAIAWNKVSINATPRLPYIPPAYNEVGIFLYPERIQNWDKVSINFTPRLPYVPPEYNAVTIEATKKRVYDWNKVSINLTPKKSGSSTGEAQYVGGDGFAIDSQQFGQTKVRLAVEYLKPAGITATIAFGTTSIKRAVEFIKPGGLDSLNFGAAQVENFHRRIPPFGINSQVFGTSKIYNLRTYLQIDSINPPAYDYRYLPKVEYADRAIQVQGIAAPDLNPKPESKDRHLIAYGVRYLQMNGYEATLFGHSGIYYNPRFLEPRGIFDQYNAEHKVSPKIIIHPEGFDANRFGSRIIPESQSIYPFGFKEAWGENGIHNYLQYVVPKGFLTVGALPEYRWGNTYAYNLKQFITQNESSDSGLFPPSAGKPELFNRNRQIKTHGHDSQRFGFQLLENGARVLGPSGIVSPIEVQPTKSFIAYRNRKVIAEGIDHPFASTWHQLTNAAALVQAKGFDAARYGTLTAQNTRRYFRFITGGELAQYGTPMISHGIRHIQADPFYTIGAPLVPMPKVENAVQFIHTKGFESQQMGWLESYIRWNRIYPRYTGGSVTGEPVVKNRNEHPKIRGFESMEFGNPSIDFFNKTIQQNSFIATLFGRLSIGDSKRFLEPASIKPVEITRFHEVYEIGTGHYPVKRILPTGFHSDKLIGTPVVLQNNIIVTNEGPFTRFGNTQVRFLGARVEPGIWEMNWGVPRVEYKTRTIYPQGKDFLEFFPDRQPAMMVSAHTIYAATTKVPEQAVRNHASPELPLHPIGGYDAVSQSVVEPGAKFGQSKIDHYHRYLKPYSIASLSTPRPEIRNTHHVIAPKGINAARVGMIAPLGDQTVLMRGGIASRNTFGELDIKNKVITPNDIKPVGISALGFGANRLEHFHRSIQLAGINSMEMGRSKDNDTPYTWQGLHVGPPMPTIAGGDNYQIFGTAWISHAVRELLPEGNDFSVVNEYDLYAFQHRMKVWNADKKEPSRQQVYTQGFVATSYGVPNIKHAAHYIRPDGNSEQYRKGAPSKGQTS